MIRVLVVILMLLLACDGSASAGPSSVSGVTEPSSVARPVPKASEVPPEATTIPPAFGPPTPTCTPPVRVTPKTLAALWPNYLGRRVSLRCQAVRRIDFRVLVVADGTHFVVTGSPSVTPCSASSSTFTVIGSTTVAIAGRTVLPELLLEENDECTDD